LVNCCGSAATTELSPSKWPHERTTSGSPTSTAKNSATDRRCRPLYAAVGDVYSLGAPAAHGDIRAPRLPGALSRIAARCALAAEQSDRTPSALHLRVFGHLEGALQQRRQHFDFCPVPDVWTASLLCAGRGNIALDDLHFGSAQPRQESGFPAGDLAGRAGGVINHDSQ